MSYWWIDAILIAVIVIYALIGLSKGFFESVLRLISTAVAVGLAVWLARPASTLVNSVLDLVKWYEKALSSQPDPLNIFGQQLTHAQAAGFLSIVTTGIVIFVLVKIIIWILAKIFDSSTKNNTALSGLNRLLGLAFGLAKACVIIAAALGTISMLSSLPAMQKAEEAIQGTKV
ncbi:MAG: CvpA family protein, partial [Clostridia bacterium]|nr:CvpA family protein [Clostridia bacterium]